MHTTNARNPLMNLIRALLATRRRVVIVAAIAALTAGAVAFGYWTAESGSGGTGASSAASVNQGPTPTPVAQAGRKVALSWGASTLSNGHAVDGYTVKRYNANTDALATTLSSCSG